MTDAKPESLKKASPPAKPTARPWFWLRHIPFAITLGLFLTADVIISRAIDVSGDAEGGVVLGIVFAQVVLLAVWTAMGPARLLTRTLTGFGGMILVALSLVSCISGAGSSDEGWLFFVITVVQWIAIQIPFWICRLLFGWRLCWPGEQVAATTRRDMQFGIGQLMVWTAFIAVTLGISRMLLPDDFGRANSGGRDEVIIFSVLTIYNCLLAWPIAWSTLAPRWWGLWLCAAVVCCIGLTWAEVTTFQVMMRQGSGTEIFWVMNGLQAVAASVALLAMRASGFRLTRVAGTTAGSGSQD